MIWRRALSATLLSAAAVVPVSGQASGDTAPAVAQDKVASASATAARELMRVCVDTAASPAAVRALAASEGWQTVDPLSLPVKNRVVVNGKKKSEDRVYTRNSAWTYTRDGVELTIGLFDYPDLPQQMQSQCEVMAWDLDSTALDEALLGDARVSAEASFPGLPLKNYRVSGANLNIRYVASDAGSKMIHSFTVN
ncbi:hypothetical protein [Sphingopyxis sp.]|jgi:hypothetical protein|uniref:hypothetical protein n=1 Tax=Sphingopyxis sp. TaxID=1908224 RepID=UPI003F6FE502